MRSLPPTTSTLLALLNLLLTHPLPTHTHGHSVPTAAADADWATRHMAEEHHIANMDPPSFFTLHDFDSNGLWTPDEIRRTYGLDSTDDGGRRTDLSEEKKREVVAGVLGVFDADGDGAVSRAEFVEGWYGIARGGQQGGGGGGQGKRLPDFGTGPGHHGDDEYEYEIHHFEKFHDENTREEDLTHPEDIAHFRKHDEMDAAAERQRQLDRMQIVVQNIPHKYRRGGSS